MPKPKFTQALLDSIREARAHEQAVLNGDDAEAARAMRLDLRNWRRRADRALARFSQELASRPTQKQLREAAKAAKRAALAPKRKPTVEEVARG